MKYYRDLRGDVTGFATRPYRSLDVWRVLQRQVLYIGEINDSQKAAWTRAIKVFADDGEAPQVAIFPDDRAAPPLQCEAVLIRVSELSVHRPRQWGACWLALELRGQLA